MPAAVYATREQRPAFFALIEDRLVVWRGLQLAILGLGLGLVIAALASPVVSGQLFGVSNADPGIISLTVMILVTVSFTASLFPAMRAARTELLPVLRQE